MSDHTLDGIRIAIAVAFVVGMFACASKAALLTNGRHNNTNHHDHRGPPLHILRWVFRLVGFLSLLAAWALITRV